MPARAETSVADDRSPRTVPNGPDAWDDGALMRAYDRAIARHADGEGRDQRSNAAHSPSSSKARRSAGEVAERRNRQEPSSVERERAAPRPLSSPSAPREDSREWDRSRDARTEWHHPSPPQMYYYAEHDYARAGPASEEYRRRPGPPPRPYDGRGGAYNQYDGYGGAYNQYDGYGSARDRRDTVFEEEFAQFSPFGARGGRDAGRMGYARATPPRAPPDMTESAFETARSYADDGYDPDELANLLMAWYYAGYYTGAFSRAPAPRG